MQTKRLLTILVLFTASFLSACQPDEAIEDPEYIFGEGAIVESLDILILESFPVQVRVNLSGYLPDGCTELHEITVERQDQDFILTIQTRRPTGDIACTEALVPFEESINLDVVGLEAGTYNVIAQDQQAAFTLDVDNKLSD